MAEFLADYNLMIVVGLKLVNQASMLWNSFLQCTALFMPAGTVKVTAN